MERRYRLQKNGQFQYVYRRGKSAACKDLVMLYAKGKWWFPSKKGGNAVVSQLYQALAECFRPYLGDVKKRPVRTSQTFRRGSSPSNPWKSSAIPIRKQGGVKEGESQSNEAFSVGPHPVLPAANQSAQAAAAAWRHPHPLVLRGDAPSPAMARSRGLMAAWRVLRRNPFSKGAMILCPKIHL